MTTFYDDFERANGPLGGNWQTGAGTPAITGGAVSYSGTWFAYNTTINETGRHEAEIHVYVGGTSVQQAGVIVKTSGVAGIGFWLGFTNDSAPFNFRLSQGTSYTGSLLAVAQLQSSPGPYVSIKLVWDNGHLSGYLNGVLLVEADSGLFANNPYMGISGTNNNQRVQDFRATAGNPAELSIDPAVIPNYGECSTVTLTGTEGTWTPGTPGSPIFTVDHGTISAQTITDAYHVTLTYCPGNYLGPVCFTDPSTGTQVCTIVTSDPDVSPPTPECPFDDDFVDTANATVRADNRGLPTLETIIMPGELGWGNLYLLEAIRDIWYTHFRPEAISYGGNTGLLSDVFARLWGGEEWQNASFAPAGTNSLMDWLSQVYTIVNTMSQGNTLTLQTVLDALGQGGGSNQDVLDAIGTSWFDEGYTLHDDLDYLDNRSDHSLEQIQTRLGNIWGTDHWALSQIVGAPTDPQIESFASLHNIYARLQAIRGDTTSSVANAQDYAQLAAADAAAVKASLQAFRTGSNYTVQSILDAIVTNSGVDLSPVLEAIGSLRGDESSTVKFIQDSLNAYRTGSGYTVQHILDAVGHDESHPNYDALALIALLTLALMGDGAKITTFVTKLASGKLDLIVDIIGTIIDGAEFFLDLWTALRGPQTVTVSGIVRAYPGVDNVQLLDPIPFVDGANIVLAMHGALIDIATPGEHPYAIKNTQPTRYGRLGTFAFACDVERLEAIQPIQYLNFVATPKAIVNPTGLVVQCKQGTVGTVIPYRIP